jgi:ferredoxin
LVELNPASERRASPRPVITFEKNGARRMVDAALSYSLMEAAKNSNVRGIAADCGGGACAAPAMSIEAE